jgi:hypothetical protein
VKFSRDETQVVHDTVKELEIFDRPIVWPCIQCEHRHNFFPELCLDIQVCGEEIECLWHVR